MVPLSGRSLFLFLAAVASVLLLYSLYAQKPVFALIRESMSSVDVKITGVDDTVSLYETKMTTSVLSGTNMTTVTLSGTKLTSLVASLDSFPSREELKSADFVFFGTEGVDVEADFGRLLEENSNSIISLGSVNLCHFSRPDNFTLRIQELEGVSGGCRACDLVSLPFLARTSFLLLHYDSITGLGINSLLHISILAKETLNCPRVLTSSSQILPLPFTAGFVQLPNVTGALRNKDVMPWTFDFDILLTTDFDKIAESFTARAENITQGLYSAHGKDSGTHREPLRAFRSHPMFYTSESYPALSEEHQSLIQAEIEQISAGKMTICGVKETAPAGSVRVRGREYPTLPEKEWDYHLRDCYHLEMDTLLKTLPPKATPDRTCPLD